MRQHNERSAHLGAPRHQPCALSACSARVEHQVRGTGRARAKLAPLPAVDLDHRSWVFGGLGGWR